MIGDIIRMGMVGCGDISHTHANAAKSIKEAKFVTCCDVVEDRAIAWKNKYECDSHYTSLEAMLSKEKIDAIVLCTWPIHHLAQIDLALKYGVKNILCEKALTLTGNESMDVWRLIQKNKAFLMEACKYRHHPAIQKIESIISSGEYGNIDHIGATFSNYEPEEDLAEESRNWRYRRECGGGVPYDWMSYLVNAANHFSNSKPKRVFASGTVSSRYNIITRLYGMIEYENGITATISSSKNASFSQELEITCAKGIINLPVSWGIFGNVKLTCRHRMQDWPYILTDSFDVEHKDSFSLQMKNFIEVIRGNSPAKVSLCESIINVFTIEALVTSVIENRIVEIHLPEII